MNEVQKDGRWVLVVLIQPQLVEEITTQLGPGAKIQVCDERVTAQYLVEAHHPDLVFCPLPSLNFRISGLPLIFLSPDLLHIDYPESLPATDREHRHNLFLEAARRADLILTVSNFSRERLLLHYGMPGSKVRVIPHALPNGLARENKPGNRTTPHFLYPANFWKHKNHKTLLVGYKIYAQRVSRPWPLVLTGHPDSGDSDGILESIRVLRLGELVEYRGYLKRSAYRSTWAGAGALVFPSNYEGFGLPLLEAMEWETPILAADLPSLREVAGSAALFVDQKSPWKIAEGLSQISSNATLRNRLVEEGRERKKAFAWRRSAETFSQLAAGLLQGGMRRGK